MKLIAEKSSLLSASDPGRMQPRSRHGFRGCLALSPRLRDHAGPARRFGAMGRRPWSRSPPAIWFFWGRSFRTTTATPHCRTSVRKPVEAIVTHFMPHLLARSGNALAVSGAAVRLFERARRGLRIGGRFRDHAEAILLKMVRARFLRRPILLLELLDLLSRSKQSTAISSEGFLLKPRILLCRPHRRRVRLY